MLAFLAETYSIAFGLVGAAATRRSPWVAEAPIVTS